jgi:hypothetical protein
VIRALLGAVLLFCGTVGCSCTTVRGAERTAAVQTEAGPIQLEFVEWHEETSELLRSAVPEAAKALSRWGGLLEPVRITVVNSHWELEEMVGRPLPGISAWARRTQIVLWDPRWWPLPASAKEDPALAARLRRTQVTGLLKHELTHSLMFQHAGRLPSETQDRIPFWFREGMASFTAGEGQQWPPPESLSQWLAKNPDVDVLRDGAKLSRTNPGIAYGAGYHAFDFLIRRYGDATVMRVLDLMRVHEGFPAAFREALGISVESFTTDFRRYLGWRGFMPALTAGDAEPALLTRSAKVTARPSTLDLPINPCRLADSHEFHTTHDQPSLSCIK